MRAYALTLRRLLRREVATTASAGKPRIPLASTVAIELGRSLAPTSSSGITCQACEHTIGRLGAVKRAVERVWERE